MNWITGIVLFVFGIGLVMSDRVLIITTSQDGFGDYSVFSVTATGLAVLGTLISYKGLQIICEWMRNG